MDDTQDPKDQDAIEELAGDEKSSELNSVINFGEQINSHLIRIENLKEDMKPVKEMLDAIFENDLQYKEKADAAKKAAKDKSAEKKRILGQPQAADLDQKLKDMKSEMVGLNEALSYYLREYQRSTGANEFEDKNGELKEIVFTAKLVKRGASD